MKTVDFTYTLPDDFDVHMLARAMERFLRQEVGNFSISYSHPKKGGKMCVSSSRPSFAKAEQ